jgi:hypothetical protein
MMPQPLGGRWFRPFHPFTMAQPDPTPGEVLLERYGVKAPSFAVASGVPGPTGEFAEPAQGQADAIKLTDDQRNEFIDIYANMKADYGNIIGDNKPKTVSEALDAVENTKMFKDASVGGKTTILNTIVNGVYHGSYQVFLGSHPDIATQIQTNRGEKQISNAPPAQQDQLRQELDSSIKDYQLQLNNQMHEYQMMNLRKDSAQPGESIDSTKDAAAINDIYR